jgi:hypothetical protein
MKQVMRGERHHGICVKDKFIQDYNLDIKEQSKKPLLMKWLF